MSFNEYMGEIDFSDLRQMFLKTGKLVKLKKADFFIRQDYPCKYIGFIESGAFRYSRVDGNGKEHIVGYSFVEDFVCDYPSIIKKTNSFANAQAVTDSVVYVISVNDLNDYWDTNMVNQRFGRIVAEHMFVEMYGRLLGFYCDNAEQRYVKLLERCPNLPRYITLKEIASFLAVTPETISHIRRKIKQKTKILK